MLCLYFICYVYIYDVPCNYKQVNRQMDCGPVFYKKLSIGCIEVPLYILNDMLDQAKVGAIKLIVPQDESYQLTG